MSGRAYIVAACAVALTTLTAVAAGAARNSQTAEPIFSAANVLAFGDVKTRRCDGYTVTRGTYTGRANSVDARLGGSLVLKVKVSARADGSGVATGKLTIRDKNRKLRAKASVHGVVSNHATVVGLLSGKLYVPNASMLATTTVAFDQRFTTAGVRIAIGAAPGVGVVFGKLPKC